MSSTSNTTVAASSSGAGSQYQDQLIEFCRDNQLRSPVWQIVSDRRGGRTAWSSTVQINGHNVPARFWYDGQYVNNAKEDAAEKALQMLGQLPSPAGPQPAHLQQQHQQQYQQQMLQQQQRSQQVQAQPSQSYRQQQSNSQYYGLPTS